MSNRSIADTKTAVKQKVDVSKVATRGRQVQRCPVSFASESESSASSNSSQRSGAAVPPVKGI